MSERRFAVAPEEIDHDFVPHARAGVASVALPDGLVLGRIEPDTTFMETCALNLPGSLIWQCFDGLGSIADIARDIAEVYGLDLEETTREVRDFARDVGGAGFLEGVEVPAIEVASSLGLAEGATFPTFTTSTTNGAWSSAELLGHPALLVSWSETCRYCASITAQLADLAPAMSRADIELVLIATDGHASDPQVDDLAFASRALRLDDEIDPFAGLGTPVAYFLDASGRVAAPIALGASDVVSLARALAGRA